jgi:hypothetical protein
MITYHDAPSGSTARWPGAVVGPMAADRVAQQRHGRPDAAWPWKMLSPVAAGEIRCYMGPAPPHGGRRRHHPAAHAGLRCTSPSPWHAKRFGGSSNGRTADSDSVNLGSNPSPPASLSGSQWPKRSSERKPIRSSLPKSCRPEGQSEPPKAVTQQRFVALRSAPQGTGDQAATHFAARPCMQLHAGSAHASSSLIDCLGQRLNSN